MQKVWFRKSKNAWFATILEGGRQKQIRLVTAPNDRDGRKLAEDQLLKELAARDYTPSREAAAEPVPAWATVAHVVNAFLAFSRGEHSADTAAWHKTLLTPFVERFGKLRVARLRKKHVRAWVQAKGYNPTSANKAIGVLKRAYNWAEELGYIPANPVRKIKKPAPARREEYVTPEDWVKIRDSYKPADPFRVFLEFCWETGARPQEAKRIEPRHVHLDRSLIAIPPKEAKGRKKWRVIRLEGRALEIVRERMAAGTATLFTNRDGRPWTTFAVNCRFCRLKEKLGEKFCQYEFRHGFTQRLLVSGVDHLTVAALLGHSDGQMVTRVYSHMDQDDGHLRDALKKAATANG